MFTRFSSQPCLPSIFTRSNDTTTRYPIMVSCPVPKEVTQLVDLVTSQPEQLVTKVPNFGSGQFDVVTKSSEATMPSELATEDSTWEARQPNNKSNRPTKKPRNLVTLTQGRPCHSAGSVTLPLSSPYAAEYARGGHVQRRGFCVCVKPLHFPERDISGKGRRISSQDIDEVFVGRAVRL